MQKKPPDVHEVADLAPDPRNPRRISEAAASGLGESMRRFGDIALIVWNRTTGHLVAGHQRMAQLRAAGATEWTLDGNQGYIEHPTTHERFAVRVVEWDATTERAANLAANNPSIGGAFTADALAQLEEIAAAGVDLGPLRLDALMEELREAFPAEPETGATDPDAVPEPPKEPVTRAGDLWLLGEHRLLCGDATDGATLAALLAGESCEILACDPPYNIGLDYGEETDDAKNAEAYAAFTRTWFDAASALTARQIVTPGYKNLAVWLHLFVPYYIAPWVKTNAMTRGKVSRFWCWEPILFFGTQWPRGRANDIFDFPAGMHKDTGGHPCPKPVRLWAELLTQYASEGATVLDPFLGSGTTLVAAERLRRKARCLEIAPAYCDVAILRWEQFTGKVATLASSGRTFAETKTERHV